MCSAMSAAGSSMSSSMECVSKKQKTTIPVLIVEDHNEVTIINFYCLYFDNNNKFDLQLFSEIILESMLYCIVIKDP